MKFYPIPSHRLQEIVKAPKCLQEGQSTEFRHYGSKGHKLDARLALMDGHHEDMRLFVHTSDPHLVTRFESGFCIAGPRVRGIGYSPVRVMRKYKEYIPKGWHENVIDPNLPGKDEDHNRHIPLPDFSPTDLRDFTKKSADRWNIQLDFDQELL
ncbi:MAG: hypothetical protein SNJ84_03825 [Verrucomicrobiia bacterium]